jgi:hypothetical protein
MAENVKMKLYKTAVLYVCETSFLTLNEEHSLGTGC